MIKKILILLLLFNSVVEAQQTINTGTPVNSFSGAGLAVGNGTAFAIPGQRGVIFTWSTSFVAAPTSITIILQGSLDNINWFSLDSSTVVTGEIRYFGPAAPKFVRCRINAVVAGAGSGLTCSINIFTFNNATVFSGGTITTPVTFVPQTEPATGTAGKFYYDSGTNTFRFFNGTVWGGLGGSGAPTDATYITQTANATLSAEQALGALATGILKSTTGTGVISIAAASDLPPPGSDTQIIFNDVGVFGGDAGLTYNKTTDVMTAGIFEAPILKDYTIGAFKPGVSSIITRNATANIEGFLEASALAVRVGAATNHDVELYTNNSIRWSFVGVHLLAPGGGDIGNGVGDSPRIVFIELRLQVQDTSTIRWENRSIINSPVDGVLGITNNETTGFTRLVFGTNDTSGTSIVKSSTETHFRLGDGTSWSPTSYGAYQAAPSSPSNGQAWVECTGTSPSRVCATKVFDGAATRTIASITY